MAREDHPVHVLMILESGYPVRGGGGAESQVRTLAAALKRRGHRVTVLTPRVPNAPQARIDRCDGIPVIRLPVPRLRGLARLVLWARAGAFLLRHGRRYDAWHAHIAHYLAALACLLHGRKPILVKVSGWWELKRGVLAPGAGPLGALARAALRRADAVQAISRRIANELAARDFSPARIVDLPNAVDTARFVARTAPAGAGGLNAIFVGRLVPEKGLDTLLDAWAQALRGRSDARLALVGGGPLEADLRARATALGIAGQVDFLGHREDIATLLGTADLGLLPSTIEGLSNTLLEYMASGLPVIASRVSGSEDFVVPGRNGWLFDVDDAGALASNLADAAHIGAAARRALGEQARRDVAATADVNVVVERLLALYRGARASRPAYSDLSTHGN